MSSRFSRAVAWSLPLLLCASAQATLVISQTIEEMTHSSPVIVRGTVGQVQARWDEPGRKIWTYAELKVLEALKGEAPPVLLVRQPGGVVGPVGQHVEGVAKFAQGEEVLLFLEGAPDEPAVFGVWGLAAGKVTLKSERGELRAERDLRGLSFYQRPTEKQRARIWLDRSDDLGPGLAFLERVRRAVRGGTR